MPSVAGARRRKKSGAIIAPYGEICGLALLLFGGMAASAEDVLWRSGPNLYVKLAAQDQLKRDATPPNQHPARLDAETVTRALESIEVWNRGGLLNKREMKKLFSLQQARLLGQYVSVGLSRAEARQDLVFVLARSEKKYRVIQNTGHTGGRIFYLDDKLHIIIGDYDAAGDRFKEMAQKSHGVTDVRQHFKHGRRARVSGFKGVVVGSAGLSVYKEADKARRDWLVVDLEQAAAAYLAERDDRQRSEQEADPGAEAERLARERREMRLEMARMRKAMRASGAAQQRPVEERLKTLEQLRDKDLITDSEYQERRTAILEEI